MLTIFINTLMSAEADAVCGATYGEPSPDRVNVRNGYRHRDFDSRAGNLDFGGAPVRQCSGGRVRGEGDSGTWSR
jgi:putative transposase